MVVYSEIYPSAPKRPMSAFIHCMHNPDIKVANTGFMAVLTSKDTQPLERAFTEIAWLEAHVSIHITARLSTNYTMMNAAEDTLKR